MEEHKIAIIKNDDKNSACDGRSNIVLYISNRINKKERGINIDRGEAEFNIRFSASDIRNVHETVVYNLYVVS